MSTQELSNANTSSPWFSMFQRLRKYKQAHGHSCVSSQHDECLQEWALLQITHYKNGTLEDYHKNLLLKIGVRFPKRFPTQFLDVGDNREGGSDGVEPLSDTVKTQAHTNPPMKEANMKFVTRNAKPPWPFKTRLPPNNSSSKTTTTTTAPAKKPWTIGVPISTERVMVPQTKAPMDPAAAQKTTTKPSPETKTNALVHAYGNVLPPAKEVWCGPPDDELEGGWQPGWIKRTFQRMSGKSKGSFDSYWYPPHKGKKLRSMVEVRRFLNLPQVRQYKQKKQSRDPTAKPASKLAPPVVTLGGKRTAEMSLLPTKKRVKKTNVVPTKEQVPRFTQEDIRLIRSFVL